MNKVIPILFVLGFLWVPFLLVPALGLFFDDEWKERHIISVAALAGFLIWFGWGWHCLTGRFPLVSAKMFWSLSLAVHLTWMGILWREVSFTSGSFLWTIANLLVAIVGLLPASGEVGWSQKAAGALAYALPSMAAGAIAVIYFEEGLGRLGGVDAWVIAIVAAALAAAAWCLPRRSTR